MIVPDNIRKCVAFLGFKMADGSFKFAGSVLWIGQDNPETGKAEPVYAVTARHVIDGIRRTGVEAVWFRINQNDGNAVWKDSKLNDWFVHPSDPSIDIAILKTGLRSEWDHLVLPYSLCMTDDRMAENEVGLGDEVFITGLFRHHHGTRKNIPIVRVGNLACLTEEKVETNDFGLMDAFLIEARSIGGLSGSPVFLNLGVSRMIGGQLKHAQSEPIFYLLGLIIRSLRLLQIRRLRRALCAKLHSIELDEMKNKHKLILIAVALVSICMVLLSPLIEDGISCLAYYDQCTADRVPGLTREECFAREDAVVFLFGADVSNETTLGVCLVKAN